MTEHETTRIVAWTVELRRVHSSLREAVRVTREALEEDPRDPSSARDLQLYCRGFCVALGEHHRAEDRTLFPAIEAAHPELAPVLRNLMQDHSMIDHLLTSLSAAAESSAPREELERHLDGVTAIMESHFAYEERQLLAVLDTLGLDQDPQVVLGAM
ncbi:hemerythrin domain-containing protein [Microbacterium yannicii]|uniref:hemerythrin domain-containing protein n=1 Tax=Microbacterium yannicii TaxID=671622 RepID=UPI0018872D28|nr:hemerythrin domain-containing protein [Microbacterium yannicii]MCO5953504.1 hemerythrin domain-containing protein [Microbacterium yannicii]